MNLFNKKLLQQKIEGFKGFPEGVQLENTKKIITGWVKSLKDSDLSKTKEKSVEKSFLIRIFSDALGYIDMGTSDDTFNLYPDYTIDGLYADGALGFFSKDKKQPLAVIELKDALTSLDKKQTGREKGYTPVEQAYQYSTKLDGCNWIIVSNFREIRIYNKSKSPDYYEKIDVLDLENDKEFKRFFYIFSKANLLTDGNQSSVTDNLLSQSTAQDEDITKAFYKEYKEIRLNFYNHLLEFNSEVEKIVLLEKAQKTLDRLIFVLFCEDTNGLLPLNISKLTYELGKKSRDRSDEKIWREYKNLFMDIDEGRFDIDPPINKYNGGLFKHDEILDNLHIKDSIWDELLRLSKYDFDSDINVNILGHIFEQSISDLESIKAEISGEVQEKSKSKRKKDGIFYTPEYITKYIVENSVGKYLEEHPEKLETIKILDPACGSGSMLNQAHSFLLQEYRNRFEQMMADKESKKEMRTLFDYNPAEVNRGILLNNLFGVDLNQESVEITKLSLWLKTASKVEPLQNLDKNIKCGNSLIDDPEIAGEKAFDWNKEYKEIMDEGGFDVIIGNPPYVFGREKFTQGEKDYFNNCFETSEYQINTFIIFIEKAIKLLNNGGYLGFIIPNSLLKLSSISKLRKYILENSKICNIVTLEGYSFDNVNVETVIIILQKGGKTGNVELLNISSQLDISKNEKQTVDGVNWSTSENADFDIFINVEDKMVIRKVTERSKPLCENFIVKAGLQAYEKGKGIPEQTAEDVVKRPYDFNYKVDDTTFPYLDGKDISRYFVGKFSYWLKYGDNLAAPRTFDLFSNPRILIREITAKYPRMLVCVYTEETYLNNRSIINILDAKSNVYSLKFLLGFLNSKLASYIFIKTNPKANRSMFPKVILENLKSFPIPNCSEDKKSELAKMVDEALISHKQKFELTNQGKELLIAKYNISKIPSSLTDIFALGFNGLLSELAKLKVKLSTLEQSDLQDWYKTKNLEFQTIKNEIDIINFKIDQEVYLLYELTDKEIKIVESQNG